MAFIFRTYFKNGRKYAKCNRKTILVEPSVQDRVRDICKSHFEKFRIQFYESQKPTFIICLPKDADTSLFDEDLKQAFGKAIYYDIIRTK